jgi:hypothetical protein
MSVLRFFGFLCVLVTIAAGCGSDSKPPPADGGTVRPDGGAALDGGAAVDGGAAADGGPVTDGGAPSDGGSNCPDAGVPCNTLTNGATTATRQQVAQNTPAFTGGTPVPGTYFSTASTVYTGPGGATGPTADTERTTLVMSASSFQVVSDKGDGCAGERFNANYTTSGNQMTATFTCGGPPGGSQAFLYTATSTTFTLNTEANKVLTFTKQ